ncbi:MAG: hypothetical protein HFG34_11970 [Eubacterium sp.]|nr:hypothetical protein [Eubacterium sp.]
MQFFISEYGKIVLAVVVSVFIVSVVFMSFLAGWNRAGGVSDSEKTNFSSNEERRTPPELYVKDFKVKSGEKVDFGSYLSALDFDRRDLSSWIQVAEMDASGKVVTAYNNILGEDEEERWGTPGIYRYLVRVQSPITGKVTEKRLLVLVDYGDVAGSGKNSSCGNEEKYENGN